MDEVALRQRLQNVDRMLLQAFEDRTNFDMLLNFKRYWEDTYHTVVHHSSHYSHDLHALAHEVALRVRLITACFQNVIEFGEAIGDVMHWEMATILADSCSASGPRASKECDAGSAITSMDIAPDIVSGNPSGGDSRVQLLRSWILDHIDNPYPNKDVMRFLASQCDMALNSVKYFFTNTRRRLHWNDFLTKFAGGSKPGLSNLIAAIDAGATFYNPAEDSDPITIPSDAPEVLEAMRQHLKKRDVDDLLQAIAAEKTQIEADRGFLVARDILEPGKPLPQLRSTKGGGWSKRLVSGASAVRSEPTASPVPELSLSRVPGPPTIHGTSLGPALSQPSSSSSITVAPSVAAHHGLLLPGVDNDFLQELFSTGIDFEIDDLLLSLQKQQVEESSGKKRRRSDDDVGEAEGALVKRRRGSSGEGPSAASGVAGHPVVTPTVQPVEHDEGQWVPEHALEDDGLGLSAVTEDAALFDIRNLFSGDAALDSIWNAQDLPSAFQSPGEGSQVLPIVPPRPFANPPATLSSEASSALGPFGQGLDSDPMTIQELEDLLNILNSTSEHAISLDDKTPQTQYQEPGIDAAGGAMPLGPNPHPSTMSISKGDDRPDSLNANEMQSFEAWAAAIIAAPRTLGLHPDDQEAADKTGPAESLQNASSGRSSSDVDLVQPAQTPERDMPPASDHAGTSSPFLGALPKCQLPSCSSLNAVGEANDMSSKGAVILAADHAYLARTGETSMSVHMSRPRSSSNVAPPTWTLKPAISHLPKPRRRSAKRT